MTYSTEAEIKTLVPGSFLSSNTRVADGDVSKYQKQANETVNGFLGVDSDLSDPPPACKAAERALALRLIYRAYQDKGGASDAAAQLTGDEKAMLRRVLSRRGHGPPGVV